MGERVSTLLVGILMAALGFLGLVMASGARDAEIAVFGWSLTGFAAIFVAGLLRSRSRETAAVKAKVAGHV